MSEVTSHIESPPRFRVAILVDEDRVWHLPTWIDTLPMLAKEHEIIGIWQFEKRLGKRKGREISKWYLETFGYRTCGLLGMLSLRSQVRNVCRGIPNLKALARRYGFPYQETTSPNTSIVRNWLRDSGVDVAVIMLNNILTPATIGSVRVGIINKHAALLPSCRGVLPYFWGALRNEPSGVTYHLVSAEIDEGEFLLQKRWAPGFPLEKRSMLRFYLDVFSMFPAHLRQSISRLAEGRRETQLCPCDDTYYSFPSRQDVIEFESRGHRVVRWSDLFYRPNPAHFI